MLRTRATASVSSARPRSLPARASSCASREATVATTLNSAVQRTARVRTSRGCFSRAGSGRIPGRIGGHDDDREITTEDVVLIRGFVEGLLEYLYWGPEKYKRALAAFEERLGSRDSPAVEG